MDTTARQDLLANGYSEHAHHWHLDPTVAFLNHGSFGACPRVVLDEQSRLRAEIEANPVKFLGREIEERLDAIRELLGSFLRCGADDLALVRNATGGVNTVLRTLRFEPGDELLTTNQAYNACRNTLDYVAERTGARVVVADLPFPVTDPDALVEPILAAVGDATRIALIDHVTSPTALVLPIERIVEGLAARGVDVLVDGAHAPVMLDLDLGDLANRGMTYYTGNCHKWMCTPKGSAFLYVHPDRQDGFRPLTISHGANAERGDRSRFRLEADWQGTDDPTAWLCIPIALEFLGGLLPGGLPALREHNRGLALQGRGILERALGLDETTPPSLIGSIASIPLPPLGPEAIAEASPLRFHDPVQGHLWRDHRIEVPVMPGPHPGQRLLRISGQAYSGPGQYEALAAAVETVCARLG